MVPLLRGAIPAALLLIAGCGGSSLTPANLAQAVPEVRAARHAALPAEILYVTDGAQTTRHPEIEVFDAEDKSGSRQPIYTIPPRDGGEWGYLMVDAKNDLYATNYFANATQLDVFPSGQTKPSIVCTLDATPSDATIAGDTLYVTTQAFTIEEFALPLHHGKNCPAPTRVLTDRTAKLHGRDFLGVTADPHGNLFDTWIDAGGQEPEYLDEFRGAAKTAHRYAALGESFSYSMISDSNGNLITDVSPDGVTDDVAVFPYGLRKPVLFDPISTGLYEAFAFGKNDTELFVLPDYPTPEVQVYAYDPKTAKVGKLLRSFANIWFYAGSIAVYSKV
ncbi:MAG TPA: hypothetical protein VGX91_10420 [Candidatus Cybelea sp.]|jgi:hypothetical protein|nr:hypothetical protein [Candidatus Cybelea sp.]